MTNQTIWNLSCAKKTLLAAAGVAAIGLPIIVGTLTSMPSYARAGATAAVPAAAEQRATRTPRRHTTTRHPRYLSRNRQLQQPRRRRAGRLPPSPDSRPPPSSLRSGARCPGPWTLARSG
jgi:hypothetical protein